MTSRLLEEERDLFNRALTNACYWQNRCVDLHEIIELFCLDAEDYQPIRNEHDSPFAL
jgi:hypothetical protein